MISVSSMHQKPSKLSACSRGVKISSFNIQSCGGMATVASLPQNGTGFQRSQALESCTTFPLTPPLSASLDVTPSKPKNNDRRSSKDGDLGRLDHKAVLILSVYPF